MDQDGPETAVDDEAREQGERVGGPPQEQPPSAEQVRQDKDQTFSVLLRAAFSLAAQAAVFVHGAWLLFARFDTSEYVRANVMGPGPRTAMVVWMGASALLVAGAALALAKFRSIPAANLLRYARLLAPLPIAANIPALLNWQTWQGRDAAFLASSIAMTAAFVWAVKQAASAPLPEGLQRVVARAKLESVAVRAKSLLERRHVALGAVVVMAVGYAIYMSYYTVLYHLNGYTSSFDLGIEENIVWQTLHGGPLFKSSPIFGPEGTHFGRHASFIAFAIAPLYAISQQAATLLVIEAVFVAAAAIPLYLFAERRIGGAAATIVVASYLLHPGVHGAQLYDFHFLTIAPFFFWFLVLAIDRRWLIATVVFTVLTLSIREDVAAGLAALGCFLILSGESARVGLSLTVAGLAYFGIMKFKIMPDVEGPAFLWMFKGLLPDGSNNPSGIAKTIIANPLYTFSTLLTGHKLVYAAQMLLPTAFLSLRKLPAMVLLLPPIAFTLLVTQDDPNTAPAPVQLSFQYTMHWIPYLYVGAVWILGALRAQTDRAAFRGAVVAVLLGTLLVSYQYGAILQQNTARAGFDPFRFGTTPDRIELRQARDGLLAMIPPDAPVAASEREVPHLTNRDNAYGLRTGVFDAQWIVFSFGLEESREDELVKAREVLRNKSFGVIEVSGNFALLKRGADPKRNAEVLKLIRRPRKPRIRALP